MVKSSLKKDPPAERDAENKAFATVRIVWANKYLFNCCHQLGPPGGSENVIFEPEKVILKLNLLPLETQ